MLCGKDVKKVIVCGPSMLGESNTGDSYFIHKTKHTCRERLGKDEVEHYNIFKQNHCKLCGGKVKRGNSKGEFTWVHMEKHTCKEVLKNHQAHVPLKVIVTPGGVWNNTKLVKLPTPKLARTMVFRVEAPVYGKEFKVHVNTHISGKKVFVVRGYGQIPKTCHPTLASAISNIKYRIWRHESKSGNWKYLRQQEQ
jgi:hypothetical protein